MDIMLALLQWMWPRAEWMFFTRTKLARILKHALTTLWMSVNFFIGQYSNTALTCRRLFWLCDDKHVSAKYDLWGVSLLCLYQCCRRQVDSTAEGQWTEKVRQINTLFINKVALNWIPLDIFLQIGEIFVWVHELKTSTPLCKRYCTC